VVAVTQPPQDRSHILANLASAKLKTVTFVLLLITVAGYLQSLCCSHVESLVHKTWTHVDMTHAVMYYLRTDLLSSQL